MVLVLLWLLVGCLLVPCAILFVECVTAACWPSPRRFKSRTVHPYRRAILIPAHNEALGIVETLRQLQPGLKPTDQLVVIADNCTDNTAELAYQCGATVLKRYHSEQRGKGYALDFGLKYLAQDPPDVVVMVDADCQVQPGALDRISDVAIATERPTQAIYLLTSGSDPSPKQLVSTFAFKVKNWVRPLGLYQWGQPSLLTGTGMAIPWKALQSVDLASGNIVEDMKLGLDLALAGYPPTFCPEALVLGQQPQASTTEMTQRTRWEHGHLQTLLNYVPRLFLSGLRQRRLGLLTLALDLCVPPLALLTLLWSGLAVLTLLIGLGGLSWSPAVATSIMGGLLLVAILLAWYRFAREELPLKKLLAVPFYVFWKLPLYFRFLLAPQRRWIRTEREG